MRKETAAGRVDYSKAQSRLQAWQAFECMRSSLLQAQFLNAHLAQAIQEQDSGLERHAKDRLLQLDGLYGRCLELELANTTKCLIVKLEELIGAEEACLEKCWAKLDSFLSYLGGLKDMVKHSCRKVFLGRNVGLDVGRVNCLIESTKAEINAIIGRHQEHFDRIKLNRAEVNEVFEMMGEYCKDMAALAERVAGSYPAYVLGRLSREERATQESIRALERDLVD